MTFKEKYEPNNQTFVEADDARDGLFTSEPLCLILMTRIRGKFIVMAGVRSEVVLWFCH